MTTPPFLVPSAALSLLVVPLVLGLVPRNRLYGVRTLAALADDPTWYRVNRAAGQAVLLAAGVYCWVALALPYDRPAPDNVPTWLAHLAAFAAHSLSGSASPPGPAVHLAAVHDPLPL